MKKNKYEFKLNTAEANDSHMGLARLIKPGERILELGCSSGYLTRFLKQDLGCYVVGVDIDADALAEAREFCDEAIVADLDDPKWLEKLSNDQFDTILCADVLEHLKNPAAVLASLEKFLSPAGRVLASIPNVAHASVRLELLQGHFDYERLGILDDTHLHFYTLDGCIAMLMQAGYLCNDVSYSIHDIADEVIDISLEKVGMTISEQGRKIFHAPDASAFQFILEAHPAKQELLKHRPPVLTPKPLISSGAYYSHKQEIIEALEKQCDLLEKDRVALLSARDSIQSEKEALKVHNTNHLKNIQSLNDKIEALERERDAAAIHNLNHQKNIRELEKSVAALERARDAELIHNKNHQLTIKDYELKVNASENHSRVLEQKLQAETVHNQNHLKNIQAFEVKVAAVERERDAEKQHNQNHLKNIQAFEDKVTALERERDAEKQHNQNHQAEIANWVRTAQLLDEGLFDLTLKIEALEHEKQQLATHQTHEKNHLEHEIHALRNHIGHQDAQIRHLEGVLQRVHSKVSYRAVRFFKDTPHSLVKKLKHAKSNTLGSDGAQLIEPASREFNGHDYSAWLADYGDMSDALQQYQTDLATWQHMPKIAIVMPTYNTTQACLEEALESVLGQVYPHWELCIADDASTEVRVKEILKHYEQRDARIKVLYRTENGHISKASNDALALVTADYVALMDHDDVLTPDALYWVAKTIVENPGVRLIYSDEDKLNVHNERYGPYFKPDWNPELLLSHNFICHLGVYLTATLRQIGGFDPDFDGAQDYDLAWRYVATIAEPRKHIIHIPRVLYHWRATPGSTANGIHEKPYAEPLIRKAVERALAARNIEAEVMGHERLPGALRVRYRLPAEKPLVSIVIPTRNGFSLLKRCIESILQKTDYENFEIIIVDNGSDEWIAQRYLAYLQKDSRITVLRDESPFNYAALNNKAVRRAKGEFIALLNNDLEVINDDWLSEMMSYAQHPEVGAVGAKLYYPNDLIQHAGVIVGLGGVAGHSHKHFPRDNPGFCGRLLLTQNLSAVTAACLVVRKAIFEQVGGFDEVNLSVAFNDVDLCLRIQEAGYWNVWTPYAELYHYESATRGYEDTPEKQARFTSEVEYMKRRWGPGLLVDPAYNPNLTLDREDFSFAYPPRV